MKALLGVCQKKVVFYVRTLLINILDTCDEALNTIKDEKFWYVARIKRF